MDVWFDPTNSPHVLLIRPLIRELERMGYSSLVTARDFAQTIPLLEKYGIKYVKIGGHMGKSKILKAVGAAYRVLRLAALGGQARVAVSIGSDYLVWAAKLRRKKVVYFQDNETLGSQRLIFPLCDRIIFPEAVPEEVLLRKGAKKERIVQFPGLKEEIYLWDWEFREDDVRRELGLEKEDEVIGFRPEPYKAQYLGRESPYSLKFVKTLVGKTDYKVVVFPRDQYQRAIYKKEFGERIIIPERPVDGPSFLKIASLFVSGGGTMVRESVVLGTPAISMYPGKLLSVDKWLIKEGYLLHRLSPTLGDVEEARRLKKYRMSDRPRKTLLREITSFLG